MYRIQYARCLETVSKGFFLTMSRLYSPNGEIADTLGAAPEPAVTLLSTTDPRVYDSLYSNTDSAMIVGRAYLFNGKGQYQNRFYCPGGTVPFQTRACLLL